MVAPFFDGARVGSVVGNLDGAFDNSSSSVAGECIASGHVGFIVGDRVKSGPLGLMGTQVGAPVVGIAVCVGVAVGRWVEGAKVGAGLGRCEPAVGSIVGCEVGSD